MYRVFTPGTFFFALFSKKTAKKFHFQRILVTNWGEDLRHFLIANHSFYAPDLLGARGVANPGASFFDREANFFAPKMRPDVRTKCARIHMRPPRHQSRERSEARGLLPASASIVESRRKTPSAAKRPT